VPAAALTATTWRAPSQLTASIKAPQSATLAPAQSGVVTQVLVASGQNVAAGQVLVRLQGADAAAAQQAMDEAKLAQARRDLTRTRGLLAINGASQEALEQAQAAVDEYAAQVKLDAATLATQEVVAPFAGVAGIVDLNPGDNVQAGQALTTLTAPGLLHVFFAVPQSDAALVTPGESFSLTAPEGPDRLAAASGELLALSPQIDPTTNARAVEGVLDANPPGLLPGMTGTVTLNTGAPVAALAAPSTALNDSMLGPYVFALTKAATGYTAHAVYVNVLGTDGDNSVFTAPALAPGDKVAALGGFKLTDGANVTISP